MSSPWHVYVEKQGAEVPWIETEHSIYEDARDEYEAARRLVEVDRYDAAVLFYQASSETPQVIAAIGIPALRDLVVGAPSAAPELRPIVRAPLRTKPVIIASAALVAIGAGVLLYVSMKPPRRHRRRSRR